MNIQAIASCRGLWDEAVWWRPVTGPQMRAVGVWPRVHEYWWFHCPAPKPQDAVWIEATPEYAESALLPLSTIPAQNDLVLNDLRAGLNAFFLVTADATAVIPLFCYFPTAGDRDARSPLQAILPVPLSDLSQLENVKYTLRPEGTRERYQMPY